MTTMDWFNNMEWFTKLDILFLIGTLVGFCVFAVVELFKKYREKKEIEKLENAIRDAQKKPEAKWQERFEEAKKQNPSAFSFANPTAIMYFGEKNTSMVCCNLYYVPTPKQIKNIKEIFGWEVEVLPEKE